MAPILGAPPPAPVGGAQGAPPDGRLSALRMRTPLAAPVRGAEEFIARALVAPREGAPPPAAVGDAEPGASLGAFGAALVFAVAVSAVFGAVRFAALGWVGASLDAACAEG